MLQYYEQKDDVNLKLSVNKVRWRVRDLVGNLIEKDKRVNDNVTRICDGVSEIK
jgi:hypothetical protein